MSTRSVIARVGEVEGHFKGGTLKRQPYGRWQPPLKSGAKFGHWTVVRFAGVRRCRYYLCECECGTRREVRGNALTSGRSLGCDKRECNPNFRHGGAIGKTGSGRGTPEYETLMRIIGRCTNPKIERWPYYGGATPPVKVSRRWTGKKGFENFLADVGAKPMPRHLYSMGRYLDIGNYEPGNCSWMSRTDQGAERRGKIAMMRYRQFKEQRRSQWVQGR